MTKKKKKPKKFHYDRESFFLDDVLKEIKKETKPEKKEKIGLTM